MQIVKYDELVKGLQVCSTVDEAKNISDQSAALLVYAKQTGNDEATLYLAEIHLRARRKVGEISKALETVAPKEKGERAHSVRPAADKLKNKTSVLEKAGLTRQTANRCEKLVDIPEEIFEEVIEDAKKNNKPVTAVAVEKAAKSKVKNNTLDDKKEANKAADSAGVDDNRPTISHMDYSAFLCSVADKSIDVMITDPPYSTDVDDIVGFAESWLPEALSKVKQRAYICIGAYPEELHAYLGVLLGQDEFIVDNPLIWTYRNTLGQTPKERYNLNYQVILHLYKKGLQLDTSITNEMFSVQDINAPDGRHGDRYHTWQKPSELANRLVRHSTKPGCSVIDPFACTGTFLIAAAKHGCMAVGCDIDVEAIEIAVERGCERGS